MNEGYKLIIRDYIMKKRNRIIVFTLIGLFIIVVALCFIFCKKNDVLDIDVNNITDIYVTNGTNGDVVEIPDSHISRFEKLLKEVNVQNGQKMDSTGWEYCINISDGNNEKKITLISESYIVIDEMKYEIGKDVASPLYNLCQGYFQ